MMKLRGYKYLVRKAHRYLGILIGIQFLCWTIGGVYFSWTKIDQVRGDDLRRDHLMFESGMEAIAPKIVFQKIAESDPGSMIASLQLVDVLGEPHYQVAVHDSKDNSRTILASAKSGEIRPPISEEEARRIATAALKEPPAINSTTYLTSDTAGADHEYREKPMPAWVVTFDGGLNVYVSAESGQVGAVRNDSWRMFDFLWMLHTLDFKARDDINNYLLRTLSVLGLITIASGFALFVVSSRTIRRLRWSRT